ncbi:MAG: membrane protein insertase YidC [Rhodobacterales bacterium]|nr:MAG: membrane protein insertase YidC [Rhodobacterales bacterium]
MENQNRNLLYAAVLSFAVITVWTILFPPAEVTPQAPTAETQAPAEANVVAGAAIAPLVSNTEPAQSTDTAALLKEAPRIEIDTPQLSGSIALIGGRIDDLHLKAYRETISPDSDTVVLLTPTGTNDAYYALYGWAPGGNLQLTDMPGASTHWELVSGEKLTPSTPITLRWTNTKGMTFTREISVDENFMFNITQRVENTGPNAQRLAPYGVIARHGEPSNLRGFFILHEGLIRQTDNELGEVDYDDLRDLKLDEREAAHAEILNVEENGWIGFTDHYWMTTLIPQPGAKFTSVAKYVEGADIYQAEIRMPTMEVAAGASASVSTMLFAGAKDWETIRNYEKNDGIYHFIDSIDWGMFFFITKPMFATLHYLNKMIGNMGWAILGLTVIVKMVLLPLAYRSYVSMARMRELQPEMEAIRERVGDDRQRQQQEIMELYKREKVNPASGCLPILLQIPIWFSLYKVIFVTLELRHQPWFGWLKDLSAPDPSSVLNLFGLLPYAAPTADSWLAFFSLGILPILLGISMWLQQKLNPAPTDETQAMIMAWMPWVFMFMLGRFASGLVLYWIANNTLTFIQQYTIMRSHGHKPDVFGNITKSFRRKKSSEK